MKLNEVSGKKDKGQKLIGPRAGVYPLYRDANNVYVYMMVPSNPKFGGALPQMGKGAIEKGESPKEAAIREAGEELGLREDNIKDITFLTNDRIIGRREQYDLDVFVAEVKDKDNFDHYGWEAKWAGWVDLEEAVKVSRKNQRQFLHMIKSKYKPKQLDEGVNADELEQKISELQAKLVKLEAEHHHLLARQTYKDFKWRATVSQSFKDLTNTRAQLSHLYGLMDLHDRGRGTDILDQPKNSPLIMPPRRLEDFKHWQESIAPAVEQIKMHCKPFLKEIGYGLQYPIYRGMKGTSDPVMTGRVRLDDRKPMATGKEQHDYLNEYFEDRFGEPFRNAMFVSGDKSDAGEYGNIYMVFPIHDFAYVWSRRVGDLFAQQESFIENSLYRITDDGQPVPVESEKFFQAMDTLDYQDDELISAIKSGHEIMIRTEAYYGIYMDDFVGTIYNFSDYHDSKIDGFNYAVQKIRELFNK